MTDIVERLRACMSDSLEWEAADEIERLRAVPELLEARLIIQTLVNLSADMSEHPLSRPLREIQDDEQALLVRAQKWCRKIGPITPREAALLRVRLLSNIAGAKDE